MILLKIIPTKRQWWLDCWHYRIILYQEPWLIEFCIEWFDSFPLNYWHDLPIDIALVRRDSISCTNNVSMVTGLRTMHIIHITSNHIKFQVSFQGEDEYAYLCYLLLIQNIYWKLKIRTQILWILKKNRRILEKIYLTFFQAGMMKFKELHLKLLNNLI